MASKSIKVSNSVCDIITSYATRFEVELILYSEIFRSDSVTDHHDSSFSSNSNLNNLSRRRMDKLRCLDNMH